MVALLDEPILLVNDREVGEYLDGFMPIECIVSYSADVTVKSSGSSTRKATVTSASLLTMHPCSTLSKGNFDSNVVILLLFLII